MTRTNFIELFITLRAIQSTGTKSNAHNWWLTKLVSKNKNYKYFYFSQRSNMNRKKNNIQKIST